MFTLSRTVHFSIELLNVVVTWGNAIALHFVIWQAICHCRCQCHCHPFAMQFIARVSMKGERECSPHCIISNVCFYCLRFHLAFYCIYCFDTHAVDSHLILNEQLKDSHRCQLSASDAMSDSAKWNEANSLQNTHHPNATLYHPNQNYRVTRKVRARLHSHRARLLHQIIRVKFVDEEKNWPK